MVSERPGTPGRSALMPRTSSWTGTPSCEARYSASIMASSTMELAFSRMRAGRPARWWVISWWMRVTRPSRTESGATSRVSYDGLRL
jgi:hypothetical protein